MKKAHLFIFITGVLTFTGYALMHLTWRGFNVWKIYPSASIQLIFRKLNLSLDTIFYNGTPTPLFAGFLTITGIIFLTAGIYCLALILSKPSLPFSRVGIIILLTCGILILGHTYAAFIQAKLHFNVPFEYTTRLAIPFLCAFILFQRNKQDHISKLLIILPVVIAITFLAHGLYAVRIMPIPQNFLLMTSNILKVPRNIALDILFVAGILDILIALLIFIPRFRLIALLYAIGWGFLTALARLTAYYNPDDLTHYFSIWAPEFLVRSGHFLLPLAYWYFLKSKNKSSTLVAENSSII